MNPMNLFEGFLLLEISDLGWKRAMDDYHRMLRHQAFFANAIINEIILEDRWGFPEGTIEISTLYGEGD